MPSVRSLWWLALCMAVGCGTDDDSTPTLPPDQPSPSPTPYPDDDLPPDDPVNSDLQPAHTLTQVDEGTWTLSPSGGYPTAIVGNLTSSEFVDHAEDPSCQVEYSLTGTATDSSCPDCTFTFRVLHTLVEGDLELCHRTDLPESGEYREYGFVDETGSGQGYLYYNYYDTGEWLPWYEAARYGDLLVFEWQAERGLEEVDP